MLLEHIKPKTTEKTRRLFPFWRIFVEKLRKIDFRFVELTYSASVITIRRFRMHVRSRMISVDQLIYHTHIPIPKSDYLFHHLWCGHCELPRIGLRSWCYWIFISTRILYSWVDELTFLSTKDWCLPQKWFERNIEICTAFLQKMGWLVESDTWIVVNIEWNHAN